MAEFASIPERTEEVARQTLDAAFCVHRALGPGLLEAVYEACLCYELSKRNLRLLYQEKLPVVYEGVRLETGLRPDVLVEECLIVEIKAVERMIPLFDAQLLTYLKLTGCRLGLLINFNVPLLKDGIKRVVH